MRKFSFGSLAVMLTLAVGAVATGLTRSPEAAALRQAGQQEPAPLSNYEIIPMPDKAQRTPVMRASRRIASVQDLAGTYVQTYGMLTTTGSESGSSVTITPIAGTDSVLMDGFWDEGMQVRAAVNVAAGTITIPRQVIYNSSTYGACDLAVCTSDGKPDRSAVITGKIEADGSLTIDTWWGVYVNTGQYADTPFGLYYNTRMERANGTLTRTVLSTGRTTTYGVIVEQTSANILNVTNIANKGQTVNIIINRDSTASMASQLVADNGQDQFYSYAVTYDATGNITDVNKTIYSQQATTARSIRWTDWVYASTTTYWGIYVNTSLDVDFDIAYPQGDATFEGEGTQTSPYLVKSFNELALMQYEVAMGETYEGKFFKVANPIDLTGCQLVPIGDADHEFNGTFDGAGQAISNLQITDGKGYIGLFGKVGKKGALKNVYLNRPTIASVGTYTAALVGYSDGTIDGCHVDSLYIYNGAETTGALAGQAASLVNSWADNGRVVGQSGFVGGLAGAVIGQMTDCHATAVDVLYLAPVDGRYAAGLASYVRNATVADCYYSGTISYSQSSSVSLSVGGITGYADNSRIERCFVVGTVVSYGNNSVTGGIAGVLKGTMDDCYSVGRVNGNTERVGGLVGLLLDGTFDGGTEAAVRNCYTSTTVLASLFDYDSLSGMREAVGTSTATQPVIQNVYFDKQVTDFGSANGGMLTEQLTAGTELQGLNPSRWVYRKGYYPRLKGMDNTDVAQLGASAIVFAPHDSYDRISTTTPINRLGNMVMAFNNNNHVSLTGHYFTINNAGTQLIPGNDLGSDTIYAIDGARNTVLYSRSIKAMPAVWNGSGTQDNPFLIQNKEDLIKLSKYTNERKMTFTKVYFKMTADIDMEKDSNFKPIASESFVTTTNFDGTFDGGGFTIHNLKVDDVVWTAGTPGPNGTVAETNQKSFIGLFGMIGSNGTVQNLNLADDCEIAGWSYVGAIAGYNTGRIADCRNYAHVRGYNENVGGLVGANGYMGTVERSFNAGMVEAGIAQAGGVAGANMGHIENSANAGNVAVRRLSTYQVGSTASIYHSAGGVAGNNDGGVMHNVINAGYVYAQGARAGGILGQNTATQGYGRNEVTAAVSYGIATAATESTIGGMAGMMTASNVTLSHIYWDAQLMPFMALGSTSHDAVNATTTAALTSGEALEGLDTQAWQFDAAMYPTLKALADEPTMERARRVVCSMPEGVTVNNVKADATLSSAQGLQWSLAAATHFSIEGNALHAPGYVQSIVTDTLTALYEGWRKDIVIKRIVEVPLAGDGTENTPYLIATADDWNAFAQFVDETKHDFDGQTLRIAGDISFSGKTMNTVSISGAVPFQGHLQGGGHTLQDISLNHEKGEYRGIFGTLGNHAVIDSLTLAGTISITTGSNNSAGWMARNYGTLMDCVNKLNVTSRSAATGGFASYSYTGAQYLRCVNQGTVSGTSGVAGITSQADTLVTFIACGNEGKVIGSSTYIGGIVAKSLPSTFIDCYNSGEVRNSANYAAGICAQPEGTAKTLNLKYLFKRCYNTGTVTATGAVGGVLGVMSSTAGRSQAVVDSCYNVGTLQTTSASTGGSVGGIIMEIGAGCEVTNCWNTGTFVIAGKPNIGGIVGRTTFTNTEQYPIILSNCWNTADIKGGNLSGGVYGFASAGNVTLENCYNTGNVECDGYGVGGIMGFFSTDGTPATGYIHNCWNTGDVTGTKTRVGGLVGAINGRVNSSIPGYQDGVKMVIEQCFNTGNVTSTCANDGDATQLSAEVGGTVGGLAGLGSGDLIDCYNTGNVTAVTMAGGLVGYPLTNANRLERCYTTGKVNAPADASGHIVGVNPRDEEIFGDDNRVVDCVFVDDNENRLDGSLGQPMSLGELACHDMGQVWTAGDDYTLPRLADLADLPAAVAHAAVPVLSAGDTFDNVTRGFCVGLPQGATWSAGDFTGYRLVGNRVRFVRDVAEEVTFVVTAGECSVAWPMTVNAPAELILGDVNGNGEIDVADVNEVVNVILGRSDNELADINGDGKVDVSDINALINILLTM